jgi:vanillate O-demethylase ferredoxin subunit
MSTTTAPSPAASAENTRHALIDVVLSDVEHAARDTNAYTFRRPDGGKLPGYQPGAHIDIHLPNGLIRQFSLLNPNADPDSYVVATLQAVAARATSSTN